MYQMKEIDCLSRRLLRVKNLCSVLKVSEALKPPLTLTKDLEEVLVVEVPGILCSLKKINPC